MKRTEEEPGLQPLTEAAPAERRTSPAVVAEAEKLAQQVHEETGLPLAECLKGALKLAQYVGEFRGVDVELDPDRLSNCPVCRGTGWQILECSGEPSGARPCPACDAGITRAATDWLNAVRPVGRGGKRYENHQKRRDFDRIFKHLPVVRERLIVKMQELEKREGKKGDGAWD